MFGRNLNTKIPHDAKYLKPQTYRHDDKFVNYQNSQK